jgi:hypothetical protein
MLPLPVTFPHALAKLPDVSREQHSYIVLSQ